MTFAAFTLIFDASSRNLSLGELALTDDLHFSPRSAFLPPFFKHSTVIMAAVVQLCPTLINPVVLLLSLFFLGCKSQSNAACYVISFSQKEMSLGGEGGREGCRWHALR